MSEKIVQLNEEIIKGQIKELVRESVEETLIEVWHSGAVRQFWRGLGHGARRPGAADSGA